MYISRGVIFDEVVFPFATTTNELTDSSDEFIPLLPPQQDSKRAGPSRANKRALRRARRDFKFLISLFELDSFIYLNLFQLGLK